MSRLLLNEPIFAGGKEFIIIQDYLGQDSLDPSNQHDAFVIAPANNGVPPIFCLLNEILEVRAQYPSVPIYGIIQLAQYNNIIDFSDEQCLLILDKMQLNSGIAVAKNKESQRFRSALLNDGFSASIPDLDLQSLTRIIVDADTISLPEEPIRTIDEIEKIDLNLRKRSYAVGISAFLIVLMIGTVGAYILANQKKGKLAELQKVEQELVELQAVRDRLISKRMPDDISNRSLLQKLTTLYSLDENFITVNSQGGRRSAIPMAKGTSPQFISTLQPNYWDQYPWLNVRLLATGEWLLEISE